MDKCLSIIIVTYNSLDLIFDCLNSIFKYNDIGDKLEVIIVENSSAQGDVMFAKIKELYQDNLILIQNKENGGYGQGNNVGIKASKAPFVMIMNPDVRLVEPVFKRVLVEFTNCQTALVGFKQWRTSQRIGLSFHVEHNSLFAPLLVIENIIFNKLDIYDQRIMFMNGACFFIRKCMFIQAGMFDESIFMYSEERDLHRRLLQLGKHIKIRYIKSLNYLHLTGDRKVSIKSELALLKSELYYAEKYNLNCKKVVERYIQTKQFFKIIACLKRNKSLVIEYNHIICVIKEKYSNILKK